MTRPPPGDNATLGAAAAATATVASRARSRLTAKPAADVSGGRPR